MTPSSQIQQQNYTNQVMIELERQRLEYLATAKARKGIMDYNKSLIDQAEIDSYMLGLSEKTTMQQLEQNISELGRKAVGERAKIINTSGYNGVLGNSLNNMLFSQGYNKDQAEYILKTNSGSKIAMMEMQKQASASRAINNQQALPDFPSDRMNQLRMNSLANNYMAELLNTNPQAPVVPSTANNTNMPTGVNQVGVIPTTYNQAQTNWFDDTNTGWTYGDAGLQSIWDELALE